MPDFLHVIRRRHVLAVGAFSILIVMACAPAALPVEPECTDDTECSDGATCTTDRCLDGRCVNTALDGVRAVEIVQIAGDCKAVFCTAGRVTAVEDNSDLPSDDNDCTADICTLGNPSNAPVAVGETCTGKGGSGLCDANGRCVECVGPQDCTGLPEDTTCRRRACRNGVCETVCFSPNTPINDASVQTAGDCSTVACDAACAPITMEDNADTPDDGNLCTRNVCSNGVASNPNKALNAPCGAGLVCDGAGKCQGCNTNTQCGTDTYCRGFVCNRATGNCETNDRSTGDALPTAQQSPTDCVTLQCDGIGGVVAVANNAETPATDDNECTEDRCINGSASYPERGVDFVCAVGGSFCDGAGTCVECNSPAQCGAASDCQFDTCVDNVCGVGNESVDTMAPQSFQTDGDCKVLNCDGAGAVNMTAVIQDIDVPVDGLLCTEDLCSAGVPSNPAVSDNRLCEDDGVYCTGVERCVGSSCMSSGDPCPGADNDADCAESCVEADSTCLGPDPDGALCSGGTLTCTSGVCN